MVATRQDKVNAKSTGESLARQASYSKEFPEPYKQFRFVFSQDLVLPDSQYAPAGAAQSAVHHSIADTVGRQLLTPERRVARRLCHVSRTGVPETSIHKQCYAPLQEDKIRLHTEASRFRIVDSDFAMPAPPCNVKLPQQSHERQFCCTVATRADSRHDFASFGYRKDISHTNDTHKSQGTGSVQLL